jgi:O-antigen/teichoic acid export membrane protein
LTAVTFIGMGGSRFYMSVSTALRMGSSILVFIVLARALGPSVYGLFAISFTYASLISLVTDYGFGAQIQQKIGAEPGRAGELLTQVLRGKTLLTAVAAAFALPTVWFLSADTQETVAICFVAISVLLNAYADILLTGLRSAGHYAGEAAELALSLVVVLVLLAFCLLLGTSLVTVTAALAAAKSVHVVLSFALLCKAGIRLGHSDGRSIGLRAGTPYAVDSILTVLCSQIDVILVSQLFGLGATGVYQIGSRIVQGTIALAVALTGVHLPRAGFLWHGDRSAYTHYEHRMMLEFAGFGLVLATGLVILGPLVVRGFLGPEYESANDLWFGFAVFVWLRFLGAAIGICFLVRAHLKVRILSQILSLAITVALILIASRFGGLALVPWAISGGAVAMLATYAASYASILHRSAAK